jgi:hypothetical protein
MLRQEDVKFKASLGYRVRPCLKKTKQKGRKKDLSKLINIPITLPSYCLPLRTFEMSFRNFEISNCQ